MPNRVTLICGARARSVDIVKTLIEKKSTLVNFLAVTFLAGGVARLISLAIVGPPVPFSSR